MSPPSSTAAKKIDELQQSLKKKDEDMRAMEERYKRYMDKACTVSQVFPVPFATAQAYIGEAPLNGFVDHTHFPVVNVIQSAMLLQGLSSS